MEDIREKIPIILITILAILVLGAALYFIEYYDAVYYTKIDNSKVAKISSSDDMKYEYTLDCYNENGRKKEIKFKTTRELREDAYLLLKVRVLDVHFWEEVQYDELPNKVQECYK